MVSITSSVCAFGLIFTSIFEMRLRSHQAASPPWSQRLQLGSRPRVLQLDSARLVGAVHGRVEIWCCGLLGPFHESTQAWRASTRTASEDDTPSFHPAPPSKPKTSARSAAWPLELHPRLLVRRVCSSAVADKAALIEICTSSGVAILEVTNECVSTAEESRNLQRVRTFQDHQGRSATMMVYYECTVGFSMRDDTSVMVHQSL